VTGQKPKGAHYPDTFRMKKRTTPRSQEATNHLSLNMVTKNGTLFFVTEEEGLLTDSVLIRGSGQALVV